MTKESRKQTEEAKFEAFSLMCKKVVDLEQENTELKTKKIPQLERRIASIRGSHSVDAKKLNARTEQVERLKKENAELKDELKKWKDGIALKDEEIGCIETEFNTFKSEAKGIIKEFIEWATWQGSNCPNFKSIQDKAEAFLNSEAEK